VGLKNNIDLFVFVGKRQKIEPEIQMLERLATAMTEFQEKNMFAHTVTLAEKITLEMTSMNYFCKTKKFLFMKLNVAGKQKQLGDFKLAIKTFIAQRSEEYIASFQSLATIFFLFNDGSKEMHKYCCPQCIVSNKGDLICVAFGQFWVNYGIQKRRRDRDRETSQYKGFFTAWISPSTSLETLLQMLQEDLDDGIALWKDKERLRAVEWLFFKEEIIGKYDDLKLVSDVCYRINGFFWDEDKTFAKKPTIFLSELTAKVVFAAEWDDEEPLL
jgi:hypothetical protein